MAEDLLKSTVRGLQETSKGQSKTEFILGGKTAEEQMVWTLFLGMLNLYSVDKQTLKVSVSIGIHQHA